MSVQTYFVSAARCKRDTALGSTVDENVIHPYIQIAQDRHIWNALGTALYDDLAEKVRAVTPIAGNDKILLETYIQPCLTQFVFVELGYVMRLRFSNNSITLADSDVGSAADLGSIKLVMERAESIAMFYRQRLVDYLCYNTALFPLYNANTAEQLGPSTRNYFGGLNVYPKGPVDNRELAILQALNINSNT